MPRFEMGSNPTERRMPRRNLWNNLKDAFQSTLIGGYVTAKWRQTVQFWWYNSFARGVYTRRVLEDSGQALARYFDIPIRFGSRRSTQFVPVDTAYGRERLTAIINGMTEERDRLLGLMNAGTANNQQAQHYHQLNEFINTYLQHQTAYQTVRAHEQVGEANAVSLEGGIGADFRGEDGSPAMPTPPSPEVRQRAETITHRTTGGATNSYNVTRRPHMVEFQGRWYVIAPGEGTLTTLFEEANFRPSFMGVLRNIVDWREINRASTHVYPPHSFRDFHFNLIENRMAPGESPQENFDKTMGNLQKALGDTAGRSYLYKMMSESLLKRWWHHGVTHVTGRVLAQARNMYSHEFGGGLIPQERIPGHGETERVSLRSLSPSDLLAVTKLLVEQGLPGSQFKIANGLSSAEVAELNELRTRLEEDPETNSTTIELIDRSFREGINIYKLSLEAASQVASSGAKIKPHCDLIVNQDGTLDVSRMEFTREGNSQVYIPLNWRPYYVHRWNIPTISPEALRIINYLPRMKAYAAKITSEGKARDITLFQYLVEERQRQKGDIMRFLHEGSADSAEDMAIKLAAAFQLDEGKANDMYLVLHELAERWDGTRFDHMRRQVARLLYNLDNQVKTFYFTSGMDNENFPQERYAAYNRRGEFLFRISSDDSLLGWARAAHDAKQIALEARREALAAIGRGETESSQNLMRQAEEGEKSAEELMKKMTNRLKDQYGSEIAVTTHETEHTDRRILNIVSWLMSNHEVLTTFFIGPSEMAQAGIGRPLWRAQWYRDYAQAAR